MKRRDFLKSSMLLALATQLPPNILDIEGRKIGLQLYTLRDDLKADFAATLKQVATLGYKEVELAGYADGLFYGHKPKEFKIIVNDLGLKIISSHNKITLDSYEKIISDCKEVGSKYVILPWLSNEEHKTIDQYKTICDLLNKAGELCKSMGMKVGYHNHAFEFETVDGQIPYEVMLKSTNENVIFEADLYWITKANRKPLEFFEQYPKKFELWHVKDMDNTPEKNFTEIGNGTINFAEIFAKAKQSGMKHFFVEQDKCLNNKPLKAIEISINYLKNSSFL